MLFAKLFLPWPRAIVILLAMDSLSFERLQEVACTRP
jgi:hypothetical protein